LIKLYMSIIRKQLNIMGYQWKGISVKRYC